MSLNFVRKIFKYEILFIGLVFLVTNTSFVQAQEAQEDAEQKFQGFNLEGYTDEGEKSWDVNGDTADIHGTEIILSNVDANSYGEQVMNVTADIGIIDQASGNMRLENDVVITIDDGTQLMTDSLEWNKEEDLVTTEDDVFISDQRMTVTGKGLKASPGLKNVKIQKDVRVRVNIEPEKEEGKTLTITSDGPMVIDQASSKARFEVNVVAIQDDQMLKADIMEIYFNKDMNGIQKMICIGNVEITQGENKSYANKVVYDADTGIITLSGRPKLMIVTEGENGLKAFGN